MKKLVIHLTSYKPKQMSEFSYFCVLFLLDDDLKDEDMQSVYKQEVFNLTFSKHFQQKKNSHIEIN